MNNFRFNTCVGCNTEYQVMNLFDEDNSSLYCSKKCKEEHSLFLISINHEKLNGPKELGEK